MREIPDIPALVIADYYQQYNNRYIILHCLFSSSFIALHFRFFGSRYDVLENLIGQDNEFNSSHPVVLQLTNLATTISQALLNMSGPVTGGNSIQPKAKPETIYNLLHCFLENANCSFFRSRVSHDNLNLLCKSIISIAMYTSCVYSVASGPLNRYVTVSRVDSIVTKIVFQLVANFTGVVNSSVTECDSEYCSTPDNIQVQYIIYYTYWYNTMSFLHRHMILLVLLVMIHLMIPLYVFV